MGYLLALRNEEADSVQVNPQTEEVRALEESLAQTAKLLNLIDTTLLNIERIQALCPNLSNDIVLQVLNAQKTLLKEHT